MKIYYNLLPICGIRRSVKRELRQLERGFYGVGLPHPGVECFIGQLNKLLTHYGSSSGLRVHMQASMEIFIIEGGGFDTASLQTLFQIQQMDHPLLAEITLGKVRYVQFSGGNIPSSPATATGEQLVADAGTRGSWIQQGRANPP